MGVGAPAALLTRRGGRRSGYGDAVGTRWAGRQWVDADGSVGVLEGDGHRAARQRARVRSGCGAWPGALSQACWQAEDRPPAGACCTEPPLCTGQLGGASCRPTWRGGVLDLAVSRSAEASRVKTRLSRPQFDTQNICMKQVLMQRVTSAFQGLQRTPALKLLNCWVAIWRENVEQQLQPLDASTVLPPTVSRESCKLTDEVQGA